MWISTVIVCIYISFILDLWVLPIPSEVSTVSVIYSKTDNSLSKVIKSLITLLIRLLFYITPLCLSILLLTEMKIKIMPIYMVILGLLTAVLGRIISLIGTVTLRKNYGKKVVDSSIFKRSRNPITLGMHFTIFGLLLCFNFWILWVVFPVYLWIFHLKIMSEEGFLESKYGKVYKDYKEKTPRYLW